MELRGSNAVALGGFNPAIITPNWLVRQGLLEDGQVDIEQLITPLGIALTFKMGGHAWSVSPDRLFMSDQAPEFGTRSAELMRRVLERLEHTPVHAVGFNYTFVPSTADGLPAAILIGALSTAEIVGAANGEALNDNLVVTFQQRGAQVQLKFRVQDGALRQVDFNFHRSVDDSRQAVETLALATDDLDEARRLCIMIEGRLT